jgi:large subunit ribosomal protein L25
MTGEAHEVSVQGGVVVLDVVSLTVNATPATIPQVIEIEIGHLEIGQVIRLGEITLPNGVTCDADPETVMVTALIPRVASDEEIEGEGAEGAEGEAAEGAEGEAAEGGDAAAAAPAESSSDGE